MLLSEICIKRPVFATVLSLIITVLGLIAYTKLEVREYPKIDNPVITVTTTYPGANAEIMETEVTNLIEEAVSSVDGIDYIEAENSQGASNVTVTFTLDTDPETAANNIRDKVSNVRGRLPDDSNDPVITKVQSGNDPIMYLSFYSEKRSMVEITDLADRYVKERLQTISGVASANIIAGQTQYIKIVPDIFKLAAHNITVTDIKDKVKEQNFELPVGVIEGPQKEFTVISQTDLNTPEEIGEVIIKSGDNYLVKLKDIAEVKYSADENAIVKYNGKKSIALGIEKQAVANPVTVSDLVRKELEVIRKTLPNDVSIEVAYDKATFIRKSVSSVYKTIMESIFLVVIIIFFFLGSFRSILIPIITIPVSLIGVMYLMMWLGFSINTLTLLALVLAIGLVVDDAIVMMENIFRYTEKGYDSKTSAFKGSKEIGFAIIAITITLAAVFLPIGFMDGITGKLFIEFAWTLALAVMVSGFVALTLSPMMASKILKKHDSHPKFYKKIEIFLDKINQKYKYLLDKAIGARKKAVCFALIIAFAGLFLFKKIPTELAPLEDRGVLVSIFFGPEGSSLEYTDKYAKQVEAIFKRTPEIENYFMVVGNAEKSQGIAFALLKPWDERSVKSTEVVAKLSPQLFGIPGVIAFAVNPPSLTGGASSKAIEFIVQSTLSYKELGQIADQLVAKMNESKLFQNVETDLKLTKPRFEVNVNREKAALMGLNLNDIGYTMQALIAGDDISEYKQNNKKYDITTQLERSSRLDENILNQLYVKSSKEAMIPLSSVIQIKETIAPRTLNHYNRMRSVTITANLSQGVGLGKAVTELSKVANEIIPKENYQYDFGGQSREYQKSSYSLYITFGFALIFIYLVLSAQFESFRDPLIILISVPFSIAGAIFALYITGSSLNIFSQIGLITLVGLITKNGILIVEFTNQLLEQGKNLTEAVKEAAFLRLRPILMTNAATIIGAFPLAVATGAGAASRNSIGIVIIGGLLIGTIFTLFIIPLVCLMMKKDKPVHNEHYSA